MTKAIFNNLDNILRQEPGCTTELDFIEQSSWLLFLKYLDNHAAINNEHQWSNWTKRTDLIEYVNDDLFSYLQGFQDSPPDTIERFIGIVFSGVQNKFESGENIKAAIKQINRLDFTDDSKHELSVLYEEKIHRAGNAGRNGGEYYTPRPLIRSILAVIDPHIGETVYDGACGSGGFLCEAAQYMNREAKLIGWNKQKKKTFYGREKKSLPYVIAIMNMILHGIDTPNIVQTNTLIDPPDDRYDVILANPPFGGKETSAAQKSWPIKTSETSFLFLQHFMTALKKNGRAAVVIKNTFLSNTDRASIELRKKLLKGFRLYTILDLPSGTFQGAGVRTVVLFFENDGPTRLIWYYQLDPGRSLGKTNPLNDEDLKDFLELQAGFRPSKKSWSVNVADIDSTTFDLSVKNPNTSGTAPRRCPNQIITNIDKLDAEAASILNTILMLLKT